MSTNSPLVVRVLEEADARMDRLVQLVAESVRIPSVSGDEGAVSIWYEEQARQSGLHVDAWQPDLNELKEHPAYVPVDYDYAGRSNVVACTHGSGGGRDLVLYGHIDVVPVDPNTQWSRDPYSGEVADGRVHGRGAVDMKGGAGIALVACEILRDLQVPLRGTVSAHLILDEEAGGNGTISAIQRGYYGPNSACIMLEPTGSSTVVVSGRGAQYFRIQIPGEEGGTEQYRELMSAIDPAVRVYEAIQHYATWRHSSTSHPLYAGPTLTKLPMAVCKFSAGAWPSTVAGAAVLEGTIECYPGESISTVVDAFERFLVEWQKDDPWLRYNPLKFSRFGLWFESAAISSDHDIVRAIQNAAQTAFGVAPDVRGGGGSDLRLPILYADCPTILWGPNGSVPHGVDEWVSIDQMNQVLRGVLVAAMDWCGLD